MDEREVIEELQTTCRTLSALRAEVDALVEAVREAKVAVRRSELQLQRMFEKPLGHAFEPSVERPDECAHFLIASGQPCRGVEELHAARCCECGAQAPLCRDGYCNPCHSGRTTGTMPEVCRKRVFGHNPRTCPDCIGKEGKP